jgi:hypothetical protein
LRRVLATEGGVVKADAERRGFPFLCGRRVRKDQRQDEQAD